jgi:hypothetical protein
MVIMFASGISVNNTTFSLIEKEIKHGDTEARREHRKDEGGRLKEEG